MKHVFIIGNGFDLAHGMDTRYSDFILWYLRKKHKSLIDRKYEQDKLIELKRTGNINIDFEFNSIKEFRDEAIKHHLKFYTLDFFSTILDENEKYNWVNVEQLYFESIATIFERHSTKSNFNSDFKNDLNREIKIINDQMDNLIMELKEYLSDQKPKGYINNMQSIIALNIARNPETHLVINFNYTNIVRKYTQDLDNVDVIDIHGSIDKEDKLIFGYGDEMNPIYQKMEEYNSNELLKNIKSFSYLLNDNYARISDYIDNSNPKKKYKVIIMGHSCGTSDRVLLNYIFEHDKCESIKIYHHNKGKDDHDFFERVQEISRSFKPENKHLMRTRIKPFNKDEFLPQWHK